MKKIYYLSGLPRTGNTLLSCILNQNPKVKVTPNSYLPEIIYRIFLLKGEKIFQNFPDHKSLDNIIQKIFINYYDNINAEVIFERSSWGTKFNLEMLKKYYDKNPKFLILNRPIVEIVASFIKVAKVGNMDIISKNLFDEKNGKLIQDIRSVRNIIKTKQNFLIIEYDDLVNKTKNSIEKIYKYFKLPKFKHDYSKLKQFEFNGMRYDDSVLDFDLHSIRTNKIKKIDYNLNNYLSEELINKLKNFNIYE
jgi:hypothetical protein